MHPALRVVAWFWSVVAALAVLGAVVLDALGPVPAPYHMPARVTAGFQPSGSIAAVAGASPTSRAGAAGAGAAGAGAAGAGAAGGGAGAELNVARAPGPAAAPSPPATPVSVPATPPEPHGDGVRIADPNPALLRPSTAFPGASLPSPSSSGLLPMQAYARPFDAADQRPRVAILIDGLGLADSDSLDAIHRLPGAVDLVFSAYAPNPEPLAAAARALGHEYLVSLPMEPRGYPQEDEGFRSLVVGADPAANQQNLDWALSRVQGYVGATAASDGLRGEHFAQSGRPYAETLTQVSRDGLLYIDPRPALRLPPGVAGRAIDLVLDEPATAEQIDERLAALERTAKERGSAIGLAGPLRPVTVNRIVLWARNLAAHGVVLAPVTAIAGISQPGAAQGATP